MTGLPSVAMLPTLLLGLASVANGFMIDKSCDSVKTEVQSATKNAFKWAAGARDALTKSPRDKDVDDLAKILLSESHYTDVQFALGGITLMEIERPPGKSPVKGDPTIYCTLDHLKKIDEFEDPADKIKKRRYEDSGVEPAQKYVIKAEDDSTPACGSANGGEKQIYAYTAKNTAAGSTFKPFIQLCPWYLKKMTKGKFTGAPKTSFLKKVDKLWEDAAVKLLGGEEDKFVEMDGLALLDHTILHEFSHTILGGNTKDHGYHWKKCVALPAEKRHSNADTLAYFGLGVSMIKEGIIPQKDGSTKTAKKETKSEGGELKKKEKGKRQLVATPWVA